MYVKFDRGFGGVYFMENAIKNINDLSSVLTRVQSKENKNDKLAFLIATQLEVIKSINSIGLMGYTVDSVLDLLRDNYYSLASEENKIFFSNASC